MRIFCSHACCLAKDLRAFCWRSMLFGRQGHPNLLSGGQMPTKANIHRAMPLRTCSRPRCVYFGKDWMKESSGSSKDWKTIHFQNLNYLRQTEVGGDIPVIVCFSQRGKPRFQPFFRAKSTFQSSWKSCSWPIRGQADLGTGRPGPWKILHPLETDPPHSFLAEHQAPVWLGEKNANTYLIIMELILFDSI